MKCNTPDYSQDFKAHTPKVISFGEKPESQNSLET